MKISKPQLPRVINGQPVPNVSRREMKTLGTIVDDYAEMLPYVSLDLSDETVREKFRRMLLDFVEHAATEIEWAYRRATDSALEQAHGLMRDPRRYERQVIARRERIRNRKERRLQEEEARRNRVAAAPPIEHTPRFWIDDGEIAVSCTAGDWRETGFELRAQAQEAFDRHLSQLDPTRGLN